MTIRAPYIKPPFDIPAPISSQPLGSPSVLLAVVVAAAPFFNAQFNPVTPVRAANALVQPYNSNLYTNPIPFAQFQWPRVTPLGPSVPRQAVFNNELLLNPIPFNAPTTLGGSSLFFDAASSVSPLQAYNLNLYASTAPAPPFIPRQWGGSALPRISTPPLFSVNYVGMYSLPFTQLAWGGGTFIEFPPAPAQPYNNQLYTNPIPFAQYDWSKPQSVAPKAADVYQPYGNFYTTVIVAAPFYQSSWPAVQPIKPVVPQPTPYNAQIYTNLIPFAQYDWSKPQFQLPRRQPMSISRTAIFIRSFLSRHRSIRIRGLRSARSSQSCRSRRRIMRNFTPIRSRSRNTTGRNLFPSLRRRRMSTSLTATSILLLSCRFAQYDWPKAFSRSGPCRHRS
jgi:hypothetical protein